LSAPLPCTSTPSFIRIGSLYVPGATRTVPLTQQALMADWMLVKSPDPSVATVMTNGQPSPACRSSASPPAWPDARPPPSNSTSDDNM
jgi:hypothetical protein